MANPLNVVLAIKSLNSPGGGAERVLVELANYLVASGKQVTVLTFDRDGESFYPLDKAVRRVDLAIGSPGQPTPRLQLLTSLLRIRRGVSAIHPDVVVGFMHSMYVPLGVALLGSGIRMIASEHAPQSHYEEHPLQGAMVRLVDRIFVAKTVPSDAARQEHSPKLRQGVYALANPMALSQFKGISLRPPPDPPTILCVGRMSEEKNHRDLLDAFAMIAADFPRWRLRIVGDGVLRPSLEARIDQLDMAARVSLPGMQRDVAEEYARASFVVVPSRYESFGMVTAEALASGRPVLGFDDCSGTRELVRDGENGILVEAGADRVAHLAAGMRRLMEDEAMCSRLGAAGPASIRKYSSDEVLKTWEHFLYRCASRESVA